MIIVKSIMKNVWKLKRVDFLVLNIFIYMVVYVFLNFFIILVCGKDVFLIIWFDIFSLFLGDKILLLVWEKG